MAGNKKTSKFKLMRKQFLTPVRVLLMTVLIFFLAYFTYKFFGVADFQGWLDEVLMLVGVFVMVILMAFGAVALLMWIRKISGKI